MDIATPFSLDNRNDFWLWCVLLVEISFPQIINKAMYYDLYDYYFYHG